MIYSGLSKCHKCGTVNIYHEQEGIWCYECEEFFMDEYEPIMSNKMKVIFELPFRSETCGGVLATIALAKELGAMVKYQTERKLPNYYEECDWWITYSDNPYIKEVLHGTKIKFRAIYMQSYGMSIENERLNATNPYFLCLCTTQKIEQAIIKDGRRNPYRIGFGLDMEGFVDYGNPRKNYLAIMYHNMPSKKYDIAVRVADLLFSKGIIEGVISFGMAEGYNNHKHPKGLVKHYSNATRTQVAEVFNQCKAYLMPSVSEGLNLTPIESTLCGCPSIIVDGAIGEIFMNQLNCIVAKPNDYDRMFTKISEFVEDCEDYSEVYGSTMREIIKGYTWSNVANKLKELL